MDLKHFDRTHSLYCHLPYVPHWSSHFPWEKLLKLNCVQHWPFLQRTRFPAPTGRNRTPMRYPDMHADKTTEHIIKKKKKLKKIVSRNDSSSVAICYSQSFLVSKSTSAHFLMKNGLFHFTLFSKNILCQNKPANQPSTGNIRGPCILESYNITEESEKY